jgi:hypothetical protein
MTRGIVTQGNPITILARVQDQTGALITQADISAIAVSVVNTETSAVTDTLAPTVASTVYNSLQTDARWTTDAVGYNLAVNVDPSAFNSACTYYQVQITITPVSGSAFRVVAAVETLPLYT